MSRNKLIDNQTKFDVMMRHFKRSNGDFWYSDYKNIKLGRNL